MRKNKAASTPPYREITAVFVACMTSIYLLYTGTGGYASISTAKWTLFLLLSFAYPIAMLSVIRGKPPKLDAVRRVIRPEQALILGYWLCSAASTAMAVDRRTALFGANRRDGLLSITLYCLCFLLISTFGRAERWLLWPLGGAMTAMSILSILQFAGLNPLRLYPEGMTYYDGGVLYSGEYLGTLGNVDVMSAAFCAAIPIFWIALVKLDGRRRFLLLIPLTLSLFVLIRARVSGGILGVFAGALLTVPVLAKRPAVRRALWAAVATAVVAGLVCVYVFGGQLGGSAAELSALLHGQWDDNFGSGRLMIWRTTLALVPERLLFGGGPDTLGLRNGAYFERYDPALDILIRGKIDAAHNEYLNILVNQGCWRCCVILEHWRSPRRIGSDRRRSVRRWQYAAARFWDTVCRRFSGLAV